MPRPEAYKEAHRIAAEELRKKKKKERENCPEALEKYRQYERNRKRAQRLNKAKAIATMETPRKNNDPDPDEPPHPVQTPAGHANVVTNVVTHPNMVATLPGAVAELLMVAQKQCDNATRLQERIMADRMASKEQDRQENAFMLKERHETEAKMLKERRETEANILSSRKDRYHHDEVMDEKLVKSVEDSNVNLTTLCHLMEKMTPGKYDSPSGSSSSGSPFSPVFAGPEPKPSLLQSLTPSFFRRGSKKKDKKVAFLGLAEAAAMKENRKDDTPDGDKKPAAKKKAPIPRALVFIPVDGASDANAPCTPKSSTTTPKTPSRSSKRLRGEAASGEAL